MFSCASRPLYFCEEGFWWPLDTRLCGVPETVWMLWRREISVALLGIRPHFLGCPAYNLVINSLGIESGWVEVFHTCPEQPWGLPSLPYNGYQVFPWGKAAGTWRPPTPSSIEVKKRVEDPSGLLWPVLG